MEELSFITSLKGNNTIIIIYGKRKPLALTGHSFCLGMKEKAILANAKLCWYKCICTRNAFSIVISVPVLVGLFFYRHSQ